MARVTFSQQDILRSKLVPTGWYLLLVKSYSEEQASTDGSANHVFQLDIKSGDFSGVPIRLLGNEKGYFPEFIDFCDILTGGLKAGVAVDFEKLVGKEIDGFIQRGEWKGRPQNQVVAFRRSKTMSQEQPAKV